MDYDSPGDDLIAFISIDNAIELALRTFLDLPGRFFANGGPPRAQVDAAVNNFPTLLNLAANHSEGRIAGIDLSEIVFFHNVRNSIYHRAGLSVESAFVGRYFEAAKMLIEALFSLKLDEADSEVLAHFRAPALTAIQQELEQERYQKQSEIIRKGMAARRAAGLRIGGAQPKDLTQDEVKYAKRRYDEGAGFPTIVKELNQQRGVFEIAEDRVRRREQLTSSNVRKQMKRLKLVPERLPLKGRKRTRRAKVNG